VVSFTPRPIHPRGKRPRYALDRRLGGPQIRSGQHAEMNFLDRTGTRIQIMKYYFNICGLELHFGLPKNGDYLETARCAVTSY
jgi:hypothetical protein